MRELEVRLGRRPQPAAWSISFDVDHAQKVLACLRAGLRSSPGEAERDSTTEARHFLKQAVNGLGRGWQSRLRSSGPVRRDDEGQAVDACDAERGRRHSRRRCHVPGRDVQLRRPHPPEHRLHQKAARACSRPCCRNPALTSRATCVRHQELMEASGYGRSSRRNSRI